MMKKLFDFVFCCLSQEQQEMLYTAAENHNPRAVYDAQQSLVREKHGYRCSICGKFYPYIELDYRNTRVDPRKHIKVKGTLRKGKKTAVVFNEQYYYAQNKKTLLKFEADSDGIFKENNMIPIMGEVYHTIVSSDEKYIATETFGGTIAVIDLNSKQYIARKRQTKINGNFIFTKNDKILYFYKGSIRLWDFCKDEEESVWSVPAEWKNCEDPQRQIHIVCSNIIYNRNEQTYLFAYDAREKTYVVVLKDLQLKQVVELPGKPANCKLVFEDNPNQYTLPTNGNVIIYDSDFRIVETIASPYIVEYHDGGGVFPVTRHVTQNPNRVFLSPDGKWLLLDYFTMVVLMRHENLGIEYCLYSYTGKVAQHMGFVDNNHFWYTWGDTTYIQEIGE